LNVAFHDVLSLFGFFIFLIIANQLISGIMLSFSFLPDSMVVPLIREEEDLEDLFTDDFFWLHERGVDLLFIFVFLHLIRKLYLNVADSEQEHAWKTGSFAFLLIQAVVFLGLVLCCTHLSDITITIAVNALHTFFFFIGKVYWLIFTDKTLNCDTVLRLALLHYVSAFVLTYVGVVHGLEMHYDWKDNSFWKGIKPQLSWWSEVLPSEVGYFMNYILLLWIACMFIFDEPEALSYELFMWGDVGMNNEIRFYSVAPHWYFRPYMAWLIVCPFHYLGIFGLIFFFTSLYFQVSIVGVSLHYPMKILSSFIPQTNSLYNSSKYKLRLIRSLDYINLQWKISHTLFFVAIASSLTHLPYGRFYNAIGANPAMLLTYLYIFSFLGFLVIRYAWLLNTEKTKKLN